MRRIVAAAHACVSDAHIRAATSLFSEMHAAPTPENAERLAQWLGKDPVHVRALDIALTEWGLAQSGHPVGDVRNVGNVRGGSGKG